MSVSPQPLSSEEPEQQPAVTSSEETFTQPAAASDSLAEETEQQPVHAASEDILTSPPSFSGPVAEETGEPLPASESNEAEDAELDEEDADFEPLEPESSSFEPSRSGIFIRRGWLIAAACAVVLVVLLAVLLVFVNHPKDPPTDWIASYTPPAGTSNSGKILYYLHWTNANGDLKGQMQLAANANGVPQSLTIPAIGLYNRDNHIIFVVITINGQPDTLTGKINDTNDTLTLNQVGVTSASSQLVFHIGSANDYSQATKKLGSGTK